MASGRIFLLCEAGREENSRFLLLRLIDSNMKYSGVVLRRLWFSSKSRGKKEKRSSLDQNIFSENILLASSPPPPFPVPAPASKAQQCVLGCEAAGPHSAAPASPRMAGRPTAECQARKIFFPEAASGSLAATQAVALAAGLAGVCRVFRLLPLLTPSRRHHVLPALTLGRAGVGGPQST